MSSLSKTIAFTAVLLTGLSAGVAFTHLLELPNKMQLPAADYLLVQQRLYEGFGQVLGPIELGAFLSAIAFTVLLRKQPFPCRLSLAASVCIAIALLVIFPLYNAPVNDAVDGWTLESLPADWMAYREHWEYAHAARAVLYTLGFTALILAVLTLFRPKGTPISSK